jgi:D-glycero-alpha-D-manno-heptose 1-phosphate guanylyltransferase
MEAIVLAGGFGTRLRTVVSDVPKPMASIKGVPFLVYIFNQLKKYGINRVILSVGYKYEIIQNYFGNNYEDIKIYYSIEDTPLGTGGAIKRAIDYVTEENIFILNGDTLFDVNLSDLYQKHRQLNTNVTIATKLMNNFDRYGTIEMENSIITEFHEKQPLEIGYINGGVYCIKTHVFKKYNLPEQFSWEAFIEQNFNQIKIGSFISRGYFIDIGIPDDYLNAQKDLEQI